jgi:hypothetical protein
MTEIFQLNQLELVGYLEVPVRQPAMPRLLSAIFAVYDSTTILFPPYTLTEQEVIGPVLSLREEFDDLVAREEVSEYDATQAQPIYEIWIDDEGSIHYDPGYIARKKLTEIFQAQCSLAKKALTSGSWVQARAHAIVACSANPKSLEPLGYRAAAEHLMVSGSPNDGQVRAELALTEIIAKSHLSISSFRTIYREIAMRYQLQPTLVVTAPRVSPNKYAGIAKKKPSRPKIEFQELCLV